MIILFQADISNFSYIFDTEDDMMDFLVKCWEEKWFPVIITEVITDPQSYLLDTYQG